MTESGADLITQTIETLEKIKDNFNDSLNFKGLIGLTIVNCELFEDKSKIVFRLKDDENRVIILSYFVSTCGGNSAWIESVDGIEDILGQKIINIIDHNGDDIGNNLPYGLIFNVEIVTQKGSCVIDFRSNCNGYYGANLSLDYMRIGGKTILFRNG